MRWVIHIGMQKTGSKAIQKFLANQADQIPGTRVLFAPQGREGVWHEPVYRALNENDGRHLEAALSENDPRDWDICVFSSEAFHKLSPQSIQIIREKLGEVQIVLFLRSQPELLNSLLNQYAKAHRVSVDKIAAFENRMGNYDSNFDYRVLISKWTDVFSRDAITPIIYEKGADVVRLFCDAVGIPVPDTYKPGSNPNPALSKSAYQAFLAAKSSVSDPSELPALVKQLHQDFTGEMIDTFKEAGPVLYDEQTRQKIIGNYEASNEWVRAQWFPSRRALFI